MSSRLPPEVSAPPVGWDGTPSVIEVWWVTPTFLGVVSRELDGEALRGLGLSVPEGLSRSVGLGADWLDLSCEGRWPLWVVFLLSPSNPEVRMRREGYDMTYLVIRRGFRGPVEITRPTSASDLSKDDSKDSPPPRYL